MSIRLMTIVWDVPWPSQSALLIALKMADRSNDEGADIYPSRDTLAEAALTSVSTVKRVLQSFLRIGLLHIDELGGQGPGHTTVYSFDLPLLMELHDGYKVLTGTNEDMKIEEIDGEERVEKKGSTTVRLPKLSGSPAGKRGSGENLSGPHGEPQYIHLEPSLRTLEQGSDLDLKGKGAVAAIDLKSSDVSWRTWIDHLDRMGRGDLSAKATAAGSMVVAARWPTSETPLPQIPSVGLTERSKAMAGENA